MPRTVREYPWHALERLSRSSLGTAQRARRLLSRRAAQPRAELSAALSELVGAEVEIVLRELGRARLPVGARETVVRVGDSETYFAVAIEPDGAQALLGRVLGRPLALPKQDLELGSALAGASSALVVEVARRVCGAPVELSHAPTASALELEATLLLDGQAYAACLRAWLPELASEPPASLASLRGLGLEVPLQLVVGLSLATHSDLAALGVGDAWFPGDGLWIDRALSGRGALATPHGELGVWVDLAADGAVVLRGESAELVSDVPAEAQAAMAVDDDNRAGALAEIALDAPLVVRVELGSVSLSAGNLAALKPGDVLETGKRLAEPVILRVAGRAIARGDLVDVEGELGVRIRELLGRES